MAGASASFDFEAKDTGTLNLQVIDAGGLAFTDQVEIHITNADEAITDIVLTKYSFPEGRRKMTRGISMLLLSTS